MSIEKELMVRIQSADGWPQWVPLDVSRLTGRWKMCEEDIYVEYHGDVWKTIEEYVDGLKIFGFVWRKKVSKRVSRRADKPMWLHEDRFKVCDIHTGSLGLKTKSPKVRELMEQHRKSLTKES